MGRGGASSLISGRIRLRIELSASSLESPSRAGSLAESGPKKGARAILLQEWCEDKYNGVRQTSGPWELGWRKDIERALGEYTLGSFFESGDEYIISNAGQIRRLDFEGPGYADNVSHRG